MCGNFVKAHVGPHGKGRCTLGSIQEPGTEELDHATQVESLSTQAKQGHTRPVYAQDLEPLQVQVAALAQSQQEVCQLLKNLCLGPAQQQDSLVPPTPHSSSAPSHAIGQPPSHAIDQLRHAIGPALPNSNVEPPLGGAAPPHAFAMTPRSNVALPHTIAAPPLAGAEPPHASVREPPSTAAPPHASAAPIPVNAQATVYYTGPPPPTISGTATAGPPTLAAIPAPGPPLYAYPPPCEAGQLALKHVDQAADFTAFATIPGLSNRQIQSALRGECVNLENFLTNNFQLDNVSELQSVIDEAGNLAYRPKSAKRRISNLSTWLESWGNYTRIMVRYHGVCCFEIFSQYMMYIIQLDRIYNWYAVYMFDMRHRASLPYHCVEYMSINSNLMHTIFNATCVRNIPRCARCKADDHLVASCPFPAPAPTAQASSAQKGGRQKSTGNLSRTEVCDNFNKMRCNFSACRRQHVCIGCGGELPQQLCAKHGKCAGSHQQHAGFQRPDH